MHATVHMGYPVDACDCTTGATQCACNCTTGATLCAYNCTQGLPCMHTTVQQGLPSVHATVQQGLPSVHATVQQGLPSVHATVQQGLPCVNATVQQGLPCVHTTVHRGYPACIQLYTGATLCACNCTTGVTLCTTGATLCRVACINISMHVNIPTKTLHTLIGMGRSVPAAAMPYPAEMTSISHKGQTITIKKNLKNYVFYASENCGVI